MPDARNFGDGLMDVPHYGPDRPGQAEQRLAELLRERPMKRRGRCEATTNTGRDLGGTILCWLPDGHDGWHINPHLRAGERPSGWFVNRPRQSGDSDD